MCFKFDLKDLTKETHVCNIVVTKTQKYKQIKLMMMIFILIGILRKYKRC